MREIDETLEQCQSAVEAATVLDGSKATLCGLLRKRFSAVEAQGLTLKILNLLLAGRHFRSRETVVLSHPFGIVVDPSNVCQLACPGCVHSEYSELVKLFDWPKGTLPESLFATLLKLYGPSGIAVYFCSYGELLLNLNTPKLIRMAKTYLLAAALSTSLSVRRFDPEAYVTSVVIDATGRILPCCGAPNPDEGLVFGTLDLSTHDPFNSEKYRQARALFNGDSLSVGDNVHCSRCQWNQTEVNVGSDEIRRYFRAADPWFFDRRSLHLLSAW